MSAPVDRYRLRQAIADARSRQAGRDSYLTLLADAAEAHLATLPEPKDCYVIEWGPSERVRVYTPGLSKADADELAASWNAKHPDRRYVVVRRPA